MDDEIPKRRPTDPKPGTRGPQRGSNDAFKVKEALDRKSATVPPPPAKPLLRPYLTEERIKGIESQLEKAGAYKRGGLVRGWGKARKR